MDNSINKIKTDKEKEFLKLSRIDLSPHYIDEFIEYYNDQIDKKSKNNNLAYTIQKKKNNEIGKEEIFFDLAKPNDAETIIQIIKDAFTNYPFYEMLDSEYIRSLIKSENYCVFVFKDKQNKIVGTITFILDLEKKKGYIRTFAVFKKYWGKLNIKGVTISVYLYMYKKYRNQIFIWYSETLTNTAKAQYIFKQCHVEPLAFFPNKDIFCDKVESEFLQVAYDKKAINDYRSKESPKIIIEVMKPFIYASLKFNLISVDVTEPKIKLNRKEVLNLEKQFIIKEEKDDFNNVKVKMSFSDSNSYLTFLLTPQLKNIIDIEYKISKLEELSVFLNKLTLYLKDNEIRYCECYVSAYKPSHQRLFQHYGLKPRGYIPSWQYNKKLKIFEDSILFNIFLGEISDKFECLNEIDLVMNHFTED